MRVDESCNSRSRLTANSHALSSTLIDFELVQILMRVCSRLTSQLSSTLASFDRRMRVESLKMFFVVTFFGTCIYLAESAFYLAIRHELKSYIIFVLLID